MTTQTCPDETLLSQLLLGRLIGDQQTVIEQHLETCSLCARKADSLSADDEFVKDLRRLSRISSEVQGLIGADASRIQDVLDTVHQSMKNEETVWVKDSNTTEADRVIYQGNRHSAAELQVLAPPQAADEIGRLGHYRVLEVLGSGGMGVVFRAEDPGLKRLVALKAMKPAIAAIAEAKQRFLKEAEATAAIEHDNIVTIYQVSEDRGIPFFAMQFLKGESLGSRADRLGQLPQSEVVRIGREIAEGLNAAHTKGLIHRDIKPENIWLQEGTDRVRIVDFGLVRSLEEDEGLTQSGAVLGTPKYMAPEQAHGDTVDHRCDLFSLGCVLYRLLSGNAPFEGSNLTATLLAVTQREAKPLEQVVPEVAPALAALISKLLSKNRELRPTSAQEVADDLRRLQQQVEAVPNLDGLLGQAVLTKHETEREQPREAITSTGAGRSQSPPRRRVLIGLLGGFAALVLLSILVIKLRSKDGTVVIELESSQPIAQVEIDGSSVSFKQDADGRILTLSVPEGKHSLVLKTSEGLSLTTDFGSKPIEVSLNDKTLVRAWLETNRPQDDIAATANNKSSNNFSEKPTIVSGDRAQALLSDAWMPGPEPAWALHRRTDISAADVLPGFVERPAVMDVLGRWNVDTVNPRGVTKLIRYSPDGKWLATGSEEGHVRIYDAASMVLQKLFPGTRFADFAWHPDSLRIAVVCDGTYSLRIWGIDGTLYCDQAVDYTALAWSRDGRYLLCGGFDNLDLRTADGQLHKVLIEKGSGRAVCVYGNIASSPTVSRFACLHTDGFLRFWDSETGLEEASSAVEVRGDYRGYSIRWSSKDLIAIQTDAGVAIVQPGQSQAVDLNLPQGTVSWYPGDDRLIHWNGSDVNSVDVSVSGLVTASSISVMSTYSSNMGPQPTALDVSPNGKHVALAGGGLAVFDVEALQMKYQAPASAFKIASVVSSPDGSSLACVAEWIDIGIRLLTAEGAWVKTLSLEQSNVRHSPTALVWSPNGKLLAGNGDLSGLLFCDVTNGTVRKIGDRKGVSVAWSPDGKFLAAGMNDGLVWFADAKGSLLQELRIAESGFVYLAWAQQGTLLARVHDKVYSLVQNSGKFSSVHFADLPVGTEEMAPHWHPAGHYIDFSREVRLDKNGQFILATKQGSFPSVWTSIADTFIARLGASPRICAADGTVKLERGDNGNAWHTATAWSRVTEQAFLGYDESLLRAVRPTDLDVRWTAVLLPEGKSLTVSAAGQVIDGQRADLDSQLVYYAADQEGNVRLMTPSQFELEIGQEVYPIPGRYFDKEYRFAVALLDGWKSASPDTYTVPGLSRAVFTRPGGVSLNLFIQETGAYVDPTWLVNESAKAQAEKLAATVLEKEVRQIAGRDAMWMVVEGAGTGTAITGNGPVKTAQLWVAIPRETDVVVALLTSPAGTFAANRKLFEKALSTFVLGPSPSHEAGQQ